MSRAKLRRYFRHGLFPQLIVFEAVARLGGVTRAAEELHLAQPTVSMQLKKLADTLEVQLFEQRGRRLYLTAAGERLKESCNELFELFHRMEHDLASLRESIPETLRLAAETGARHVAAQLLADFCARYPGVQASLHVATREQLLARFTAGEDDVYLFELEVDGLPAERRWSVAHAKGRPLARSAALFVREALGGGAYNSPEKAQEGTWSSRGSTTRRST
jgi:DNA-binding transcriptional LysR family regulator